MATRMQQRRGTGAQWTASNPILNIGEIGFESDNNKFKIGDGVNHWADLPYFLDEDTIGTSLNGYLEDTLLGANNGVAQLNSSGKLVSTQLPSIDELTQDAINTALVAGTGLDKTYDDNGNTITLDIDSTVATLTGTQTLTNKTLTSPVVNTPTGITKSDVGLANVDNTTDANKPVSTATQTALDLKLASATAASTYAPLASPTFTGTVSGVTKAHVGLGSVDNTTDAAKPVSTATQTALDLKANLAGPTFTGTISAAALTLSGDLTVNGTTTTINSTTLTVDDKNIVLGDVATPSDITADGGGITLKGATDKTFNWVDATDAWTSSEHINLASGKTLKYNGTDLVAAQSTSTTLNAATAFPSGASNQLYLNLNGLIEIQSSAGMAAQDAAAFNNAFPVGTSVTINGTIGAPGTAVFTVTGAASIVSDSILANITLTTGNGLIIYDNDWVMTATLSQAGKYLTTNGTSTSWATVSQFSAPTIGSTSIASGATVTTIAGLTLTAPTLTGTVTASGDINLSAANGPGSLIDELALILMGAL